MWSQLIPDRQGCVFGRVQKYPGLSIQGCGDESIFGNLWMIQKLSPVLKPAEKAVLCHGGTLTCVEQGFRSAAALPLNCQRGVNSPWPPQTLLQVALLLLPIENQPSWKSPCELRGMPLALSHGAVMGRAAWHHLGSASAPADPPGWDGSLGCGFAIPRGLMREALLCFGRGWEEPGGKIPLLHALCWRNWQGSWWVSMSAGSDG